MGEGSMANVVAVVPISHINGPREETDFYAFRQLQVQSEKLH